jgi:integrase
MTDSSRRDSCGKPRKPAGHPCFPHANGYWAKKVRGKLHYFGRWRDDPRGNRARELWVGQRDDLLAGREPRKADGELTVAGAVNAYLTAKRRLVETAELREVTWAEYHAICGDLVREIGRNRPVSDLTPMDFEKLRAALAARMGPKRLVKVIQVIRSVFKHAAVNGLAKSVVFGSGFARPSKAVLRRHHAQNGPKIFTRDELLRLIDAAGPTMRAMILLAANCGLGNADIGRLELGHLELAGGWLTYARPKTGVHRRAKLWSETVDAIHAALKIRPKPKDEAHRNRVFITAKGAPWAKEKGTGGPVTLMFGRLMDSCGVEKRRGRGFYAIRHTYRTVADGCRDQPAIAVTMGHADPSIAGVYRHEVEDSRLEAVADYVRGWLWPEAETEKQDNHILRIVG